MNYVNYKMPRARKSSKFVVYPFTADDKGIKLQSENHCIIAYVNGNNKGKMLVSPRFNQYPRFEGCLPEFGGKCLDIPNEIQVQLDEIIKRPTGKVVRLI